MRIYVMLRGNRTTISVEEQLIQYLADRVCRGGLDRAVCWKKTTREWIQKRIDAAGQNLPSKNISQWVRACIIDEIVDPALGVVRQLGDDTLTETREYFGLPTA